VAGRVVSEVDVGGSVAKSLSINFFITAALLALFGTAAVNTGAGGGPAQLALAAVMVGAGIFLRTGTPQSRVAGLAAAALTCAFGAFELVTGSGYVPGTIVAIFAFARLMGAEGGFDTMAPAGRQPSDFQQPPPYGAPPTYPQNPYGATPAPQNPYGATPAPPTYSAPPAPLAPGVTPQAGPSQSAPFGYFGQPAAPVNPEPSTGQDPRFAG
jgi:hypothetical protein